MKTNQNKFNIEPGSMYPDIEPTKLGNSQHQLLTNVRMSKDAEWELVKGIVNSKTGGTDLRAAIEVTDDLSGDRFFLVQVGYGANCLKKLTYDSGDGDGYENENYYVIDLPSGITVPDNTLRFFYFRGVVRITGASKPMWYGYIDRTLFEGAIEYLVKDTFDSSVGAWVATGALAHSQVSVTGYWGIGDDTPYETGLLVQQNGSNSSYVYRTFDVTADRECTVWLVIYKKTGGSSDNVDINIGTSPGASDIESEELIVAGSWQHVEFTFTPTEDATLYLSIHPNDSASNDELIFTWAVVEQDASITIGPAWFLEPAEVVIDDEECGITDMVSYYEHLDEGEYPEENKFTSIFNKFGFVYDDAQNTLPANPSRAGSNHVFDMDDLGDNALPSLVYYHKEAPVNPFLGFDVIINGTNLRDTWSRNRVTRLIFMLTALQDSYYSAYDDKDVTLYINQDIDLAEELDDIKFNMSDYYFVDKAYQMFMFSESFDIAVKGNTWFIAGRKMSISNENGEIVDARITKVLGDLYDQIWLSKKIEGTLVTETGDIDPCGVTVTPQWVYDPATGYSLRVGTEPITDMVTEYFTWADISALTKDTNPNYSHHSVVTKRGHVISTEDEEGDIIRYSPIGQIDVLPNVNTFITEVGDTDQNLAVVNRDNRACVLKRNSLSQMSFSGSGYNTDIGFAQIGLYATYGYMVIDNVLYIMDKAEIYAFTGTQVIPLLRTKRQRSYYRKSVTTDSFIGYNKLDQELMFFLDGTIMVYQFDYDSWYTRDHDIDYIHSLLTIDQEMYLFDSDKFVRLNHSESTFDEDLSYTIETKLYDQDEPDKFKKVDLAEMFLKSNQDVKIEITDPALDTTKSETKTPNSSNVDRITSNLDNYLFKAAKIVLTPSTATNNLTMTMRKGHVKYSRIS